MTTTPHPNDGLFDRYEALTFDDVVVIQGYSETLPDAVDTTATFAAEMIITNAAAAISSHSVSRARSPSASWKGMTAKR